MNSAIKGVVVFAAILMAAWSPAVRGRVQSSEDLLDDEGLDAFETTAIREASCCLRERNMKSVGVSDTTGEEVYLDVGLCRRRCSTKRKLKKHEFQRLLQENPDVDPILLYQLHSGKRRGSHSCPQEGEMCRPLSSRIEQVMTTAGAVSVTVTESCQCQSHPRNCRRQPKAVTLHKDTPFQTTIDVGDCQGHCTDELGCKAIKTRSVTVEGPNGSECLSVVEECGCESPCYRTSLFEHVYNYTNQDDPSVEIIDIGTCVGECDVVPNEQCVLRESNGGCLMSLTKRSPRCAPLGLQQLEVTQKDGSIRTLTTITDCGCQ